MEAFIDSTCAISPQNTFSGDKLEDVREYIGVRSIKCVEPQYNEFIDPMLSRRMSRIIKMGVSSALKCLANSGVEKPDAIVAGTSLGCIEDTEKFLGSLYSGGEKLLNPTPFIQSTHNTVAATIAIILKCNNYNNTFSHRGFSFEHALLDGLMNLQEGSAKNVLVGGLDELTPNLFIITDRLGFWKRELIDNHRLLEYNTRGSIAGEGSAFFLINSLKSNNSFAKIISINTFYKPEEFSQIIMKLSAQIKENDEKNGKIDLILMGMSGDKVTDKIYYHLKDTLFKDIPCAFFKHLCGEYDTSSAFALYLASSILKDQKLPEIIRLDNKPVNRVNKILIYNHLRNIYHSAILISSC